MFNLTELGNAERLVDQYGRDLKYVPEWGWLVWDGKRWVRDTSEDSDMVIAYAKKVVKSIYVEAAEAEDSNTRQALADHARTSESLYKIRAMVKLAQSDPVILANVDDFDSNDWLFNFQDCTVDLSSGESYKHRRKDLITRIAKTEYDPTATSKRFDLFLQEVFEGDTKIIEYVQRVVGYGLTGSTREHKMWMPYGNGRNGKSTLFNLIQQGMGDYATSVDSSLILHKGDFANNKFEKAALVGMRLVIMPEIVGGKKMDVGMVKALVGGDRLRAEQKYEKSHEFTNHAKLILYTNSKPEIDEHSVAIWDRVRLIPFNASFSDKPDTTLVETLQAQLPAIMAWAVRGAIEYCKNGLQEPDSIAAAVEEYKQEQDTLSDFLLSETEKDKLYTMPFKTLYSLYEQFQEENGEQKESKKAFSAAIKLRGYKSKSTNKGPMVIGLRQRVKVPTYGDEE